MLGPAGLAAPSMGGLTAKACTLVRAAKRAKLGKMGFIDAKRKRERLPEGKVLTRCFSGEID